MAARRARRAGARAASERRDVADYLVPRRPAVAAGRGFGNQSQGHGPAVALATATRVTSVRDPAAVDEVRARKKDQALEIELAPRTHFLAPKSMF